MSVRFRAELFRQERGVVVDELEGDHEAAYRAATTDSERVRVLTQAAEEASIGADWDEDDFDVESVKVIEDDGEVPS